MTTVVASAPLSELSRRVIRIQVMTLAWMTVEAVVSLGAAWRSHSPALLAFGGDSLIELLSAAVVFWRFHFRWARRGQPESQEACFLHWQVS